MGKFRIEIGELAAKHLTKHYRSGDKATINKIATILKELSEHPYTGTGQPEQLKYDLAGYWSRRINKKDRLIYRVNEAVVTVYIVAAMGHYLDT